MKDTKYLSIFIDRLVPSFIRKKYPNYTLFVKYFLEFLETESCQTGENMDGVYKKISEITRFIDVDEFKNECDENIKQQLIDNWYIQLIGDTNYRYISDMLDDILFIKHQKDVRAQKGSKLGFQFFFLYLLGGFVEITNIDNSSKFHDGSFQYDGLLNYDNSDGFNPFIYEVTSSLTYDQYKDVLNLLNPAGMSPIIRNKYFIGTDYQQDTAYDDYLPDYEGSNQYGAFYNENDEFLGMIRPYRFKFAYPATESDHDEQTEDGKYWYLSDSAFSQDGTADTLFYDFNFNDDLFQGTINKIRILRDPTPSNTFYSKVITDEGDPKLEIDVANASTGPILIENFVRLQMIFSFDINVLGMMTIGEEIPGPIFEVGVS